MNIVDERPIYPIALKIAGKQCVVVGGGKLATRKVAALLQAGADVTVVAPELSSELEQLARDGAIVVRKRGANPEDIAHAFVVVVAVAGYGVVQDVIDAAINAEKLLNVVDVPKLCNFYVPAMVRRGPVVVSISTGGSSPMLAKRLKQELQSVVGLEYGQLAILMGSLREEVQSMYQKYSERENIWSSILDSPVLDLLREGREEEAKKLARSFLK
jgi:siroheme synthase-like protein